MRKISILIVTLFLLLGCTNPVSKDKLQIVTSLYPQYDLIKGIVKDKADVILLLPPGVEAHSFEPSPKDIVVINESDLFVYTSDNLEVYASKIVNSLDNKNIEVIKLIDEVNINDNFEDESDTDHSEHEEHDPHFWLDPIIMSEMALVMSDVIANLDPQNADFYKNNALSMVDQYIQLDQDFLDFLESVNDNTIVFAGHFAFGYFANKYSLNYITPFENFNSNSEASIKKVAQLIDYINDNDIKVIYFEELVDPKLARMLSEETGVKTLMLHAAHNISKEELASKTTYIDIMYQNLDNLKAGLSDE